MRTVLEAALLATVMLETALLAVAWPASALLRRAGRVELAMRGALRKGTVGHARAIPLPPGPLPPKRMRAAA